MLLLALLVPACGGQRDQGIIGVVHASQPSQAESVARRHTLFVATTRAKADDPAILYSGARSQSLNLAEVAVTVPGAHVPGQIEQSRTGKPDPSKHFTITDPRIFAANTDFVRAVQQELDRRPPQDRTVLFFVHGYNTTLTEAVLRLGQFIHDSGYKGVPVLFSWASGGELLSYVYDLNSALQARDDLLETVYLVARTDTRALDVVSHSMGNLLAVEAMRQAKLQGTFNRAGRLRYVILASPDIDVDLFARQLSVFSPGERRFYVLISRDDRALSFSKWLARGVPRVGGSNAEALARSGVTVIDLSEIELDGSNHTKFAESPEIVQLIGARLSVDGSLEKADRTSPLFRTLQVLPITIVGGLVE